MQYVKKIAILWYLWYQPVNVEVLNQQSISAEESWKLVSATLKHAITHQLLAFNIVTRIPLD